MSLTNRAVGSSPRHPIFSLLLCLLLTYGVGFIAAEGANQGVTMWYLLLNRPRWAPPPWLFAPTWTVLYGLMGYALFVIRKEGTRAKVGPSTAVFCLQLALNGAWPWLFFAKHLMFVSVTEIWVLVIAIFLTIGLTWKVSGKAVAILIPYLVWMIYAAVLTTSIWNLNPAPPLEGPGQNQNITITVALQSARTTLLS